LQVSAAFVRSAAGATDYPRDDLAEIALVGRSNVGKSSLINALVRRRVARTSAAPGKTRLANIYRVIRGDGSPFYLVDLPGYGYARGGRDAAAEFATLTAAYFGRAGQVGQAGQAGRAGAAGADRESLPDPGDPSEAPDLPALAALLLVDARHPGLDSDRAAWRWLRRSVDPCAVVATKIDKLARGERIRALRELESVCETSVLPVSAVTGEGLDELWKLIDRLQRSNRPPRPLSNSSLPPPPRGTDTPARRPRRSWSSRRSRT
jgi:GTP-binding protein